MPRTHKSTPVDLTNMSEINLLKHTMDILTTNGDLTAEQRLELDAINAEFERREKLELIH